MRDRGVGARCASGSQHTSLPTGRSRRRRARAAAGWPGCSRPRDRSRRPAPAPGRRREARLVVDGEHVTAVRERDRVRALAVVVLVQRLVEAQLPRRLGVGDVDRPEAAAEAAVRGEVERLASTTSRRRSSCGRRRQRPVRARRSRIRRCSAAAARSGGRSRRPRVSPARLSSHAARLAPDCAFTPVSEIAGIAPAFPTEELTCGAAEAPADAPSTRTAARTGAAFSNLRDTLHLHVKPLSAFMPTSCETYNTSEEVWCNSHKRPTGGRDDPARRSSR